MKYQEQIQITWIGKQYECDIPALRFKTTCFYKKCIFGHLTLNIGDFVLITNADAADPNLIKTCDIARIDHMYEIINNLNKDDDKFCAVVQWYSRVKQLPPNTTNRTLELDEDLEVIEDFRYNTIISLDNIFDKCKIIYSDKLLKIMNNSSKPVYICRYKLIKNKFNKYELFPINNVNNNNTINSNNDIFKKRSAALSTDTMSPRTPLSQKRRVSISDIKTPVIILRRIKPLDEEDDISSETKNVLDAKWTLGSSPEAGKENCAIEPNKVMPIKIIAGTIIHKSYNDGDNEATPQKKIKINTIPEETGPNLNASFNMDKTSDSDILNYSIVEHDVPEMKIKLRLSRNQTPNKTKQDDITEKDSRKNLRRSILPDVQESAQVTPRKSRRISFDHNPQPPTPTTVPISGRRKSILKTPSKADSMISGTPKKYRHLTEINEEFDLNPQPSTPTTVPSGRRKSILKTPTSKADSVSSGTPKKYGHLPEIDEEFVPNGERTPRKSVVEKHNKKNDELTRTPKSAKQAPNLKLKLLRSGMIAPSIHKREILSSTDSSEFQLVREKLHVSMVPAFLPCRQNEFSDIYSFVKGKILDECGGCMYISGVPGTGKTVTVTEVIKTLQTEAFNGDIPGFEFIDINGMRLTEPRQAYVMFYKQLTGKILPWKQALTLLEKRFSTRAPRRITTVLLVDELDILCNRRQDVVYNLLNWPTMSSAQLVVITIANTMDLPERLLISKITSRLGLTRLTFQPYSHKQLQEIVTSRLLGTDTFKSDAIQLVARKVAAVSGDARRALDICRRATEIAESSSRKGDGVCPVSMNHVQIALGEMIASAKVQAIKSCSKLEKLFLQALTAEVSRTGIEESLFLGVYTQLESLSAFYGIATPTPGKALSICSKLGSARLIICEHSRADIYQKIFLNVNSDDVHYALKDIEI